MTLNLETIKKEIAHDHPDTRCPYCRHDEGRCPVMDLVAEVERLEADIELLKSAGGWPVYFDQKAKPLKDEIEGLRLKAEAFDYLKAMEYIETGKADQALQLADRILFGSNDEASKS